MAPKRGPKGTRKGGKSKAPKNLSASREQNPHESTSKGSEDASVQENAEQRQVGQEADGDAASGRQRAADEGQNEAEDGNGVGPGRLELTQMILNEVAKRLITHAPGTPNFLQRCDSFDSHHEAIEKIADELAGHIFQAVEDKQAGTREHSESSQIGFSGHPAVIYLDGNMRELGRVEQLGGEWSVDWWNKNQNGKTICLSTCAKRKRDESAGSIDQAGDDEQNDRPEMTVKGGRIQRKTATGANKRQKTSTDARPDSGTLNGDSSTNDLPNEESTADQAPLPSTSQLDRHEPTPEITRHLSDVLDRMAPLLARTNASPDAPRVVLHRPAPGFPGSWRWGFDRPVPGLRGQWQFATFNSNQGTDEYVAEYHVGGSTGFSGNKRPTAQQVYELRQNGDNGRTAGIRLVWVPDGLDTTMPSVVQGGNSTNSTQATRTVSTTQVTVIPDVADATDKLLDRASKNNASDDKASKQDSSGGKVPDTPAATPSVTDNTERPNGAAPPANTKAAAHPNPSRPPDRTSHRGGRYVYEMATLKTMGVDKRPEENNSAILDWTRRSTRHVSDQHGAGASAPQPQGAATAPAAPGQAPKRKTSEASASKRKNSNAASKRSNRSSQMFPNLINFQPNNTSDSRPTRANDTGAGKVTAVDAIAVSSKQRHVLDPLPEEGAEEQSDEQAPATSGKQGHMKPASSKATRTGQSGGESKADTDQQNNGNEGGVRLSSSNHANAENGRGSKRDESNLDGGAGAQLHPHGDRKEDAEESGDEGKGS